MPRKPPAGRGPRGSRRGPPPASRRPRGARPPSQPADGAPVRLQTFLARAGVASRRASEELIAAGRVMVNGRTVTELGSKVVPGRDRVLVDGRPVRERRPIWIALNKPPGYVTTRDDPRGRRTVYDLLPERLHHLFHVGRLDRKSEGLLLLTNEGELAHRLLHPRYGVTKEYVVEIEGEPQEEALEQLVAGVRVDDEELRAESVEVLPATRPGHTRLRLVLREGRYREVRRMLEALGHVVTRLSRRRFGPIRLGRLRRGEWRELSEEELRTLRSTPRDSHPS